MFSFLTTGAPFNCNLTYGSLGQIDPHQHEKGVSSMKRPSLIVIIFFSMINVVTAGCLPGYTVSRSGLCISPGMFECPDGARACPTGMSCNGTRCEGNITGTGPMCGGGPCLAGWLCSPAGCYDPNVAYACGQVVCTKGAKYLSNSPCYACMPKAQQASPRQSPREKLHDAVADTPKKRATTGVLGLSVREAVRDANGEWTCVGVAGFPNGPITNPSRWKKTFEHYCAPAGSVTCSKAAQSYACPTGSICFGDGTLSIDQECRPSGPLPPPR